MYTSFRQQYYVVVILILVSSHIAYSQTPAQKEILPDTVSFSSGELKLKGLLWKPKGAGPFPAMLYNHGSEPRPEKYLSNISKVFLEHGYAFFAPFRRGQGLSKGQGRYIIDDLDSASSAGGKDERIKLMFKLHETTQLQDQLAALTFLKAHPGIDSKRIGIIGLSFGGMQTMLMASRSSDIKAALNFAGAAMMWDKSTEVGEWLKGMARNAKVPVYFIQAENDFSTKPSLVLSEEMKQSGKPYQIKIYPPRGTTPMEGHTFIDDAKTWGPDVFPWLDKLLK
jgi:carboxymethylenebutenolidase